ncbi:MAG: gliding motility-associated C-terminal domain-containing protein [Bacteroidetes bacterium]|nr:gliding motility-associated C-terminal domain-containing protein [Bacteroidota bacterium]
MKPVVATCLLFMLNCPLFCYGQGENNIWCFGYQLGLDFTGGPPVQITTPMIAVEACGSVCDPAGNLLFYSNANEVYDRNNNIMPNGSGLQGGTSCTQGVAIVQSYANADQYFLFTMDNDPAYPATTGYLHYSVIDMTLNAGLGDVIVGQKNILLDSGMLEKMIVVRGSGCFSWLLVHHMSSPLFHAFKIDASGLNTNPIVSTSGFHNSNNYYALGEMKVAQGDSIIALVTYWNPILELHSFNNSTGVVSNGVDLDSSLIAGSTWYGISFSPDGSRLYRTCFSNPVGLYQYDMSLMPNVAAVYNSRTQIANHLYHSMRIGPDNKVYVSDGNEVLWAVNNPNALGPACNFGMTNLTGAIGIGNNFVSHVVAQSSIYSHDTTVCLHFNTLTQSSAAGYITYQWSDGKTTQSDTFSATGTKWVVATQSCSIRVDTFHVTAMPFSQNTAVTDTSVCFINNVPVVTAPGGYTSYAWSDGFTQQQDTFSAPGTKWVIAKNVNACTELTDTFKVHSSLDTTTYVTDTTHCVAYSPITIFGPAGYTTYLWSDGKTTQVDTFFSSTTKWVRAQNGCNILIDTVHFTATQVPQDSVTMLGTDTAICFEAGAVSVSAPAGYTYYLWSDGSTQQVDVFTGPGTKWVYSQRLCYLFVDTFLVHSAGTDTLRGRVDTTLCFSSGVRLSAAPGYLSYQWTDGNTGQTDTFSYTSTKLVYAHKACAERVDTMHAQFINDLSVNLGPDTAICKGEKVVLNATNTIYNTAKYLWQDGSTNATYTVTSGGDYGVSVSVGPCTVSDVIRVHEKVIDVKLGNGLIPCHEDSIILDAGVDNASYLWQDGSTRRTYKATKEGSYSVKVMQDDCSTTASVTVRFEGCDCVVVLPTGFSPNNDSRNDRFGPTINCPVSSFKMMIYNRWGNEVFDSEDVSNRWDGTVKGVPVDGDTFNYYIEFKDGEGKTYYYKGTVTLVR